MSDTSQPSRQRYPLPQGVGAAPFAGMARAHGLHVLELSETAIVVEGREEDLAAFGRF